MRVVDHKQSTRGDTYISSFYSYHLYSPETYFPFSYFSGQTTGLFRTQVFGAASLNVYLKFLASFSARSILPHIK